MDTSRPAQLNGIALASVEVTAAEFKTRKRPEKDGKGFIKYALGLRPDFRTKKEEGAPHAMVLHAEATLQTWSGDPPGDGKEPADGDQLMTCRVQIAVRYRIEKPEVGEAELKRHLWHFQPQVALIAREYMRGLLRDTPFASIPIPTEA